MARSVARILASAVILSLSTGAFAADLLPAPPQLQPLPQSDAPDTSGWYLRGDIGVGANINDIGLKNTPDALPGTYDVWDSSGAQHTIAYSSSTVQGFNNTSLSASGIFDVGVGYQFNHWLRGDATFEYRGGAHLQSLYTLNDPGTGNSTYQLNDAYRADVSSLIAMANVYADVGTWYGITPFVGGGVGMAHNTLSGFSDQGFAYGTYTDCSCGSTTTTLSNGAGYFKNGSVNSFAWALMAGLDFNVTHNLKLELGYRYLNYGSIKTGGSNCLSGGGLTTFSQNCNGGVVNYVSSTTRLASNDFRLGLIWTLDGDQPAPPPQQVLIRKY